MEEYFPAKALLFDGRPRRAAVVDVDDEGAPAGRRTPGAVTVSTTGAAADWSAADVAADPDGGQHVHRARPGRRPCRSGCGCPGGSTWPTRCSRSPAGRRRACPWRVAAGLAEAVVPGRMEPVDAGQPFVAVVDYAHTPDAVAALLAALRAADAGPADHRPGLRRRPRPRQAPADGRRCRRSAATCWSSPTTTRAPRTPPPSARPCSPAPRTSRGRGEVHEIGDRRAAIAAAVARPGRATPCWWPARATRPARRSAGVRAPVRRPPSSLLRRGAITALGPPS